MRFFRILSILLVYTNTISAQVTEAPYLKNPWMPNFMILNEDSTSWFSSKDIKPKSSVVFFLFNPDCDHCKAQTASITRNINKLATTEIVMSSYQPLFKLKEFAKQYNLSRFPNIHIGRDVKFFFGPFFQIRYSPFIAVYDKDRSLVKTFEGGTPIDSLINAIK
jgi:thiol-disulfide isomerase/thioredoxin